MSKFEVGDTVWCLIYGTGGVTGIHEFMHPVRVDFPGIGLRGTQYTVDGKYCYKGKRTLFFSDPKVEALTAKSKLIDQRVMVMRTTGDTRAGTVLSEDEVSISISRIDLNVIQKYYKQELIAIYKLGDNLL